MDDRTGGKGSGTQELVLAEMCYSEESLRKFHPLRAVRGRKADWLNLAKGRPPAKTCKSGPAQKVPRKTAGPRP